ncbi:MAG: hypothetical protein JSS22_00115 [Proteobacteria bacterium]|nr:hypothetical protein [Pseudomonadota bacterium]
MLMKIPIALLFLMAAVTVAHGQTTNGSNNGNGNVGYGNGNGNGTGNGNGSNNSTTASASGGTVNFNDRRNTPAVIAPGLPAAGIESCLGSTACAAMLCR